MSTEALRIYDIDYSNSANKAELEQIDADLAFLDFYLQEIAQFAPFRQRFQDLAANAHQRFPRPNDLPAGFSGPEQHLFDHATALAAAMSLDTAQPLKESTQTVDTLKHRLTSRKQMLLEAEQQKFSKKLIVQVATELRVFIGMIINISTFSSGDILTLLSQSGEIIEHIPADKCKILNQQKEMVEFTELVADNWGIEPFELATEWEHRFGEYSPFYGLNPFAQRN